MNFRIGNGIDIHQLIKNKKLILGGIHIPFILGSDGHSDGDALLHALTDSILGALALGDIGDFFPSNNSDLENINSKIFLDFALNKMEKNNFCISNTDITIILQEPPISKYKNKIKNQLSKYLLIDKSNISIKATTTDRLGFIGKSNGICVIVNTLLIKNEES